MLMGSGGNIGASMGPDGVFLVDDQFAPLHKKIVDAVKKESSQPIKFVINTHWHFDHTGGNELMGKMGATLVSHDNVRKRMSVDNIIKAFGKKVPATKKIGLPIVTFPDKINFHLNGEEIRVEHIKNAHTDGDAVIFFKTSNIIHTGDLFFNGFYPFIDPQHGGSLKGLIKGIQYLLTKIDSQTKIIPGHGPLAKKKDLENYLQMLEGIRDNILSLISKGKKRGEVIEASPTAEFDGKWGKGFLKPFQFAGIAFDALKN